LSLIANITGIVMKKYGEIFRKRTRDGDIPSGSEGDIIHNMLQVVNKPLATVEEKRFFHKIFIRTVKQLIILRNLPIYCLYHHRSEGKRWTDCREEYSVSFSDTGKYEEFSDSQPMYYLSADLPSKQEVDATTKNGPVKSGILFQFFNEYDYLLFSTNASKAVKDFFKLLEKLVSELKSKLDLYRTITDLKNEVHSTKIELNNSLIKLRETDRTLKKRIYEINNLFEISSELYSILEFDQLINSVLLTIAGQLGVQRSFALLYDAQNNGFTRYYTKGYAPSEKEKIEFIVDNPLVSYFLQNQRPVELRDLKKQPRIKKFIDRLEKLEIKILAPIVHSNRLNGLIGCGERLHGGPFAQSDLQVFALLVSIISISISNAQMYEDMKKMSFTDAMTSLNNYRYFETRMHEEINRARRSNTPVSLLMLDIDNFKNYNDTLGHQAGDEALRVIGWILKNAVRDEDIVNRYGGEEFSIILPGLDKKVISILAERIRQKVEEHPFYKEHIQPEKKITISLGGAAFPEDADSYEELVKKADEALYYSKKTGRNRFTLYSESLTKME